MVLHTPTGLTLAVYAVVVTLIAARWFWMIWGRRVTHVKHFGEDRRKVPYTAPVEIPAGITREEKYWINSRGMLLYTCVWCPATQKPKGVIFQLVGFSDSNTYLPMARSIRLVQQGYVVFGMDPEGHGRSDGLHAYIPSFPAVIDDYWQFFKREVREHPEHKGLPVFLLGESMGGNVAIQLMLRDQSEGTRYFRGAVMLAPMVKISPKIKPPEFVVNLLRHVAPLVPTLPVSPTKDVLAQAFRRPEILKLARNSPYGYTLKPRLGTSLSLIEATEEVGRRMEEVHHPFLILQGGGDVVVSPELAQEFHERASSKDKEYKLYDGLWHSLVAGELEENIELVYKDLFAWLERQLEKEEGEGEGRGGARRRSTPRSVTIK